MAQAHRAWPAIRRKAGSTTLSGSLEPSQSGVRLRGFELDPVSAAVELDSSPPHPAATGTKKIAAPAHAAFSIPFIGGYHVTKDTSYDPGTWLMLSNF